MIMIADIFVPLWLWSSHSYSQLRIFIETRITIKDSQYIWYVFPMVPQDKKLQGILFLVKK